MIADELLARLKADTRTSKELSRDTGIHEVAIRRIRTGDKPIGRLSLATVEQLAMGFAKVVVLANEKKSRQNS